jgi:hypothetical protein
VTFSRSCSCCQCSRCHAGVSIYRDEREVECLRRKNCPKQTITITPSREKAHGSDMAILPVSFTKVNRSTEMTLIKFRPSFARVCHCITAARTIVRIRTVVLDRVRLGIEPASATISAASWAIIPARPSVPVWQSALAARMRRRSHAFLMRH